MTTNLILSLKNSLLNQCERAVNLNREELKFYNFLVNIQDGKISSVTTRKDMEKLMEETDGMFDDND